MYAIPDIVYRGLIDDARNLYLNCMITLVLLQWSMRILLIDINYNDFE